MLEIVERCMKPNKTFLTVHSLQRSPSTFSLQLHCPVLLSQRGLPFARVVPIGSQSHSVECNREVGGVEGREEGGRITRK